MEAAREFKSTSGVSQEAALASLRDREGVEKSRNFAWAGYDHVATVAISGVTGRRVWHPSISQQISSPSLWRQQVTTLTSPTQRNHLIAEGRYHTARRRARAPGILFRNGLWRASIKEHPIPRATGQQYAKRCVGGFRTTRWSVVLPWAEVVAGRRLGI
jgi:hypothetical protein